MMKSIRLLGLALLPILLAGSPLWAEDAVPKPQAAARVAHPERSPMRAAARAGARIVAVGDHGVILLSDDQGSRFRQARSVPTQVMLNAVSFVDAKHGWAAGYDGTILASSDGGETWVSQRTDYSADNPLLAIHFEDARIGIAVGLFGTALATEDGGQHWLPFKPTSDEEHSDRHLFGIFGGRGKPLFIAAEAGLVLRSTDGGRTWREIQTDNVGSFWTGVAQGDQKWLVAGLRGHVFRSIDDGLTWKEIAAASQPPSLTQALRLADGRIAFSGVLGTLLLGKNGTFANQPRKQLGDLSAVLEVPTGLLLFGAQGVQHWPG